MAFRSEVKEEAFRFDYPERKLLIKDEIFNDYIFASNLITHVKIKSIVTEILDILKYKLEAENQIGLLDEIVDVETIVKNQLECVKEAGGDALSQARAMEIFQKLQEKIKKHKELHYPEPVMLAKSKPHWREHHLRIQQESLTHDANFQAALVEIAIKAKRDGHAANPVYLCFADYLGWVTPFIKNLENSLKIAGISRVFHSQGKMGDAKEDCAKIIADKDTKVLIFGTESLLEEKHFIDTELKYIMRKSSNLIPILISGTPRSSLPAEVSHLFHADWLEKSYFQNFCVILRTLYNHQSEAFFKPIWDKYRDKFLTLELSETSVMAQGEREEKESMRPIPVQPTSPSPASVSKFGLLSQNQPQQEVSIPRPPGGPSFI